MIINRTICRDKELKVEACSEQEFTDCLSKSIGMNYGKEFKSLNPEDLNISKQEEIVKRFVLLDQNTLKDIDIRGFDSKNFFGIHKFVHNRLGYHYLVCWTIPLGYKTPRPGIKACFIIYYDGTSMRGFVPYKGNPVNTIRDSLIMLDELDYTNPELDGCDMSHNEYLMKQEELKGFHGKLDIFYGNNVQVLEIDYSMCIEDFEKNLKFDII